MKIFRFSFFLALVILSIICSSCGEADTSTSEELLSDYTSEIISEPSDPEELSSEIQTPSDFPSDSYISLPYIEFE